MSPRLRSTIAILVAFAVPLGVYLASLRGSVSYWDTADLQTVPYILGIPYPTGFPGYVLIGWIWSHAFAIGNVAWRLNALCAVASAGTSAAVCGLLLSLGAARGIAFAAALLYALGGIPWSHATYVDVHPLAFCAVAWATVYAVRWNHEPRWIDACCCGAATVIALACDNTTALMLPGLAFVGLARRPPLARALRLAACAALVLIAVYAYLPLRSAAVTAARLDPTLALGVAPGRPYWDDGDPATPAGFVRVVTGSDFAPHKALAGMLGPLAVRGVADDFAPVMLHDLGGVAPWIALFGGALLWWRAPLVLAGLILIGLVPLLFASAYVVESEATRYYLPAYFVIAAAAGYGIAVFDAGLHGMQRYAILAVMTIAWGAMLVTDWSEGTPLFAQPKLRDGPAWIARVVDVTPAHAVLVVPWNYATTLAYASYVQHDLGDRIVLTASAHTYEDKYRTWLRTRPIVIVADEPPAFKHFATAELDAGSPRIYALR